MMLWLTLIAAAQPSLPRVTESLIAYTHSSCDTSRVEVVWLGLKDDLLPTFDTLQWAGQPCRGRPDLRLTVANDGVEVGRWSVRPQLKLWVKHPVAVAPTQAGAPLLTQIAEVAQERVIGPSVTGALIARRFIKEGEPITERNARVKPDALKGERVQIEVISGSLTLRADGLLLEDAYLGQPVRVSNQATHVVQLGQLVQPTVVRLK